jgi:hypothetical protein
VQLNAEFNVLPMRMWASSPACSFLLLRLSTGEWRANVPLPPPALSFTLADEFGHFLLFGKADERAFVDQLQATLVQDLTFRQLMDVVARSDLRSFLFVGNESQCKPFVKLTIESSSSLQQPASEISNPKIPLSFDSREAVDLLTIN